MIVGHDITVRSDNHTGTAGLLFPALRPHLVTEEELEERVLYSILFLLDSHLDIYDGIHSGFCGIREVRILSLCQIDSSV